MKICLVTTFPPSTGGLSEYGFHIARELRRNPFLDLTVLADQLPHEHSEPEGFNVLRCWSFDDPGTLFRLLRTIRKAKPDVVWFNLLFSTFGRNPAVAFSGLMAPLLARLSGRYTHVTLHHLMDTVELKDVGVRHETLYRAAGAVATRMILLSNSVSVLMPGYRKILNDKYGRDNVHLRAHGLLARRPEFPDFSRRGNPTHCILAFGKWGTYKRLELMIEAFKLISERIPNTKLVVAGGDHPQAAGYIESMKQQHSANSRIEFRGYVAESELADLFQSATVAVMPYSSSTGCSGVAHLACAFGVPIVSADLPDFRQMGQSEELAIDFYQPGDARGLADCLSDLLENLDKQVSMATQNFSAALRMTMPNVVQKYLRHFELQQRVQTLRHISRFRRLPRWIPSKSVLLRFMTHNSLSWARRSVVLHTPMTDISPAALLNGHNNALLKNPNNGRGQAYGPGFPVDGHDTNLRSHSSNGNGASARHSPQNHNGNGKADKDLSEGGTLPFAGHEGAANAEAQDTPCDDQGAPLYVVGGGSARDTSEPENRMPRSISGNDGIVRE